MNADTDRHIEALRGVLRTVWGYDDFRPLQAEAMQSVLAGRDSVVVLPTGGGKSLCFQAPALLMDGLAVVVSPLISLMKDQVDALADSGVPAACVNSSLAPDERRRVADAIRSGKLKLLYLSPERLMSERTLGFLQNVPLSFFAVDEAHCISDWGHDFRPEYRMLARLKELFPGVAVHAYTATATPHVRSDIARELRLDDPSILVGSFDRPNLVYRVQRRGDLFEQVGEVIDRHADDSGIIYCMRRRDVEELCATLIAAGRQAAPYHAGLSDEERRRNQDAFINDQAKIVVATVAFGMGIDKSDVRYVIHAAAPKSLENYQQESGRAGRDGLEAECWLLYSEADFRAWRTIQQDLPEQAYEIAMQLLAQIENFCRGVACRHAALVRYFGQDGVAEPCGACDVCMAEVDLVDQPLVVAQKILSCVVRLEQRFGGDYTADVLAGSREQRIFDNGHDRLSTWGLLKSDGKKAIRNWIEQLVGQGFLAKRGEYNILELTEPGSALLRGHGAPRLLKPAERPRRESRAARDSWDGVDRGLFEALRGVRRIKALERGLPPFIIFGDATLRDMARRRPSTRERLLEVHGVGEKKAAEYGEPFLAEIADYCRKLDLSMDVALTATPAARRRAEPSTDAPRVANAASAQACILFAQGKSIDEVSLAVGRARNTTLQYLVDYIAAEQITDPTPWADASLVERIREIGREQGFERLKPIFEALEGAVGYDEIRVAVACLHNETGD